MTFSTIQRPAQHDTASFRAPGKTPSVEFFTNRKTSGAPFARLLQGELTPSVEGGDSSTP